MRQARGWWHFFRDILGFKKYAYHISQKYLDFPAICKKLKKSHILAYSSKGSEFGTWVKSQKSCQKIFPKRLDHKNPELFPKIWTNGPKTAFFGRFSKFHVEPPRGAPEKIQGS